MESNPISVQFNRQDYINLETYRKDGTPVQTPVWFASQDGILYFRTMASSGKVKRLRRNPTVRVVLSDFRGNPTGVWMLGTASQLDKAGAVRVNELMKQKYGLKKWFIDLVSGFNRNQEAAFAIHLNSGVEIS